MAYKKFTEELCEFIRQCPSMFHSVATIESILVDAGYGLLREKDAWNLEAGGNYYVKRNNSSIIAFSIPKELDSYHFQMSAAHTDSPTFKIKSIPELTGPADYLKLDVEAYGGMIDMTWLDRPLSIAGRVLVENNNTIESRLFYMDEDVLTIPNVPIHFNRQVNEVSPSTVRLIFARCSPQEKCRRGPSIRWLPISSVLIRHRSREKTCSWSTVRKASSGDIRMNSFLPQNSMTSNAPIQP